MAKTICLLEIIVSDDCSNDKTFEVIQKTVAGYAGPHNITIYRNDTRLGSVDHLATRTELIGEAFIVTAHGDDIAEPHRTRQLVEAWRREGVSMVSSNAHWIGATDGAQNETARVDRRISTSEIIDWVTEILGATLAFDSRVISRFESLSSSTLNSGLDCVLPLRAAALDGLFYVSEKLIKYRRHDANMGSTIYDRTRTADVLKEGAYAHSLAIREVQRRDLLHIGAKRLFHRHHRKILKDLEKRIFEELAIWTRQRAILRHRDLVATWCPREEIAKRKVNFEVTD